MSIHLTNSTPRSRLAAVVGSLVLGLAATGCAEDPVPPVASCADDPGNICSVIGIGGPDMRGYNGDGNPARETLLYFPTDVAFDASERLVVADFNNQRIRRIELDGTVATVAGSGMHAYATPGMPALETAFENPADLVFLEDGRMLVAELHAGRVLEIDADGIIRTYAGNGLIGYSGDGGPAHLATLSEFYGVALDDDGTLYIGDTENNCVRSVSAEPVPIEGYDYEARVISSVAGHGDPGFVDGLAVQAMFDKPHHMAYHDGHLYISDAGNHAVRRLDLAGGTVETVAGTGEPGYAGDGGMAVDAQLDEPTGVTIDEDGTIFIAERGNHLIRVVHPDGTIGTFAGSHHVDEAGLPEGGWQEDDEGVPAVEARLNQPENVTIGPDGHLYIADTLNGLVRVVYR